MKKYVYLGCRVKKVAVDALISHGFEPIFVPQNDKFDSSISDHADMNILFLGNVVFSGTNVRFGVNDKVISINRTAKAKLLYPDDAYLNCVAIGKDLICNKKSIATEVIDYATTCGYSIINVNQGYTKCNIAVVSEKSKAIITEDPGIYNSLIRAGYDVCLLETHSVKLQPYEYGFIGGSCGLHNNCLYFNGNIYLHPEIEKIFSFCKKYGVEIVALSDDELEDCGSLLFRGP